MWYTASVLNQPLRSLGFHFFFHTCSNKFFFISDCWTVTIKLISLSSQGTSVYYSFFPSWPDLDSIWWVGCLLTLRFCWPSSNHTCNNVIYLFISNRMIWEVLRQLSGGGNFRISYSPNLSLAAAIVDCDCICYGWRRFWSFCNYCTPSYWSCCWNQTSQWPGCRCWEDEVHRESQFKKGIPWYHVDINNNLDDLKCLIFLTKILSYFHRHIIIICLCLWFGSTNECHTMQPHSRRQNLYWFGRGAILKGIICKTNNHIFQDCSILVF